MTATHIVILVGLSYYSLLSAFRMWIEYQLDILDEGVKA